MTATNINIEEFINMLISIRNNGTRLIDLDMLPDENHPSMNKLVIHPNRTGMDNNIDNINNDENRYGKANRSKVSIRNPEISTDNDDIFNALNDLV